MEDKTITNTPIDPNPEELYRSLKRDYQSLQTEADELRTREARLEEELEGANPSSRSSSKPSGYANPNCKRRS